MCFDARKPAADALMRAAREAGKARAAVPVRCPACSSSEITRSAKGPAVWFCWKCRLEWGDPPPAPPPPASACPACGSTDHSDIALDPPVRTCRACGWRGYVDVDDGPVPPEDRGTPAWIYRDSDGWWSYWKLPRAVERVEVSVPIGWRLVPDSADGVVLANVFGDRLTAVAALHHAERGEGGFRVRKREAVG